MAVPRIRCSAHAGGRGQLELHYWLDRLAADPALRYGATGRKQLSTPLEGRAG
jgi:hypothetical protein